MQFTGENIMNRTLILFLISLFVSTHAHAWVKKSDFEGGTVGEKANTHPSGSDGSFALTVFSDEKAHSGNQSAKATVTKGSSGWKEWGMRYSIDPKAREGDEIWFRAWLYFPPDFKFDPEHGPKGLRVQMYNSSGNSEGYFNTYTGEDHLRIFQYMDTKAFSDNNSQKNFSPGLRGQGWTAIEMYIKFHSDPGKGIFRVWRNGKLLLEDRKTRTLMTSSSYAGTAWIHTLFSNNPSPVTQSTFIDDVILTNERPTNTDSNGNPFIGVGDVDFLAPPNAPGNIQ